MGPIRAVCHDPNQDQAAILALLEPLIETGLMPDEAKILWARVWDHDQPSKPMAGD